MAGAADVAMGATFFFETFAAQRAALPPHWISAVRDESGTDGGREGISAATVGTGICFAALAAQRAAFDSPIGVAEAF